MQIIRGRLSEWDLQPKNLRLNTTTGIVEITPDNGDTWEPSPENDPRRANPFPAPTGAGADCNAAARMVAFLYETLVAIDNALQVGAATAEITTLILLIMAFIPLIGVITAILVSLAAQFVTLGYATFHAGFTAIDFDALLCELRCKLDVNNQLTQAGLDEIKAYIVATYGNPAALVINPVLDAAGFGGLNDAAATRTETGDCAACEECEWEYRITPESPTSYWRLSHNLAFNTCEIGYVSELSSIGVVEGEPAWLGTTVGAGSNYWVSVEVTVSVPSSATVTQFVIAYGTLAGNLDPVVTIVNGDIPCIGHSGAFQTNPWEQGTYDFSDEALNFIVTTTNGQVGRQVYILYIALRGTGVNPFI